MTISQLSSDFAKTASELSGDARLETVGYPSHQNLVFSIGRNETKEFLILYHASEFSIRTQIDRIRFQVSKSKADEFLLLDKGNGLSIKCLGGKIVDKPTWDKWNVEMFGQTNPSDSDILERFVKFATWEGSISDFILRNAGFGSICYLPFRQTFVGSISSYSDRIRSTRLLGAQVCKGLVCMRNTFAIKCQTGWAPIRNLDIEEQKSFLLCSNTNFQIRCDKVTVMNKPEFDRNGID